MTDKPNILIFNPDQMRTDSLGCFGNAAAHTPNFDALAAEGAAFENAFCQNPVCVPSRCSFMTGLYPHTNGHRTMAHLLRRGEPNLFLDMKAAGYHTVSSTRGDLLAGQDSGLNRSCVDEFIVSRRYRGQRAYLPKADRGDESGDQYYSFMNGILPSKREDGKVFNFDDFTVNGAIHSIKHRKKDKPFFMFVAINLPHPEYQIEKEFYDLIDKTKLQQRIPNIKETDGKPKMEAGLLEGLRVSGWSEERLREIRAVYLAMCAKADSQLGRLVQSLKDEGIYDNTIVIVLSDHGDYTTDYGLVEKSQNCFPDCLTNVPLIIKPQGSVEIDKGVHTQLAELTDLGATCLELAGIKNERVQFGKSLVSAMKDKALPHREYVFCEGGRLIGEKHCMEYDEKRFSPKGLYSPRMLLQSREDGTHTKAVMIRNEKYKYVKRLYETDEFYDLSKGESVNLFGNGEYSGQIEKMEKAMLEWFLETSDSVPTNLDERFTPEFVANAAVSAGVPKFMRHAVSGAMRLFGIKLSKIARW
ncbi:MAG: sulfatase-like hydrolase/transferase [Clostridiales bacterium]|nr:sulfatase-like hydrolase/transferase [Clostridiales bacterium]